MDSIHILDLIEKEKLDSILEAFTDATGVAAIISDTNGEPITEPYNFSNLCEKYCRATKKGINLCIKSDHYGGKQAADAKKQVIYYCQNAGLLDSAAPVFVEGIHLANILCGQVLDHELDKEESIKRAKSVDVEDIDGYLYELKKIPIMSQKRFQHIVTLMGVVTQTISELAYQKYLLILHSRQYFNKLVNSVSDCILSINKDGIISMINESVVTSLGIEKKNLIGELFTRYLSDQDSINKFHEFINDSSRDSGRTMINITDSSGRKITMQMSISNFSMDENKDSGYVAVLRDVSEEKKTERMKEDLIGMLTHDLGNPVLSIQRAVQLLSDEALGVLNKDQKKIAGLVLETSHQLYGMVADFLDIYRYENDKLSLHKHDFDIVNMLKDSINRLCLFSQDKSIEVTFLATESKLVINADQIRLMRVCINLLENALKFSPEGSQIDVELYKFSSDNKTFINENMPRELEVYFNDNSNYIMITISDEGLGIEKEDQQFIFDKFFTSKSKTGTGRKGLGLGLAFCKLVIEAHGGIIWVSGPLYHDAVFKHRGCRFSYVLKQW